VFKTNTTARLRDAAAALDGASPATPVSDTEATGSCSFAAVAVAAAAPAPVGDAVLGLAYGTFAAFRVLAAATTTVLEAVVEACVSSSDTVFKLTPSPAPVGNAEVRASGCTL